MSRYCEMIWATAILLGMQAAASAQPPNARIGEVVPRDVREMYDRGLQFLASTQSENGDWAGGQQGPGVTGLGLMVFLASGEDPNFGLYSNHVRRCSSQHHQSAERRPPASSVTACTITASPCLGWPKPTAPSTTATFGRKGKPRIVARSESLWNWQSARRSRRKRRIRSAPGGTRPMQRTPTHRSAEQCWWACWRLAMPASKCPMSRSTRRFRTTPR